MQSAIQPKNNPSKHVMQVATAIADVCETLSEKWIKKSILISLITTLLLMMSGFVQADEAELIKQARTGYERKNTVLLAESFLRLKQNTSPLAPYAEYWQILLNFENTPDEAIAQFIQQNRDTVVSMRMRDAWLRKLGKQQAWDTYASVQLQLEAPPNPLDVVGQCYAIQANIVFNRAGAYEEAKALLMNTKELPLECLSLLDSLQQVGLMNEDVLLQRFRQALFDNKITLAKALAKRSENVEAGFFKQIDMAYQNPSQVLKKRSVGYKGTFGKSLYLYMLHRMAKASPKQGLEAYQNLDWLFNAEEKGTFYAQLALEVAMQHDPDALAYFNKAEKKSMRKDHWEWNIRALLRIQDWKALAALYDVMPKEVADEPTWRYWHARAHKALQQNSEANKLFAKLSQERHFYGWLAQEELGASLSEPLVTYVPTEEDVVTLGKRPTIARMEALYNADMRTDAKAEWQYLLDNADDKTLLIAAEYAQRRKWFDLAVLAADSTKQTHNFALRYPTPYRDYMKPASQQQEIDEAWVYGIIRQESRFMHYAKSNVGAGGLMQVMPATAKWIARKLGWSNYHGGMLHDINTNVNMGTYYMRYTLDQFQGQEAMATAAYNAGPSRAKKWAADKPLEGAIYAETIPFSETRNYVKKVLANAHMYAPRLGLSSIPLKQRLGLVPGKTQNDATLDDFIESIQPQTEAQTQ
jgi:soluble lytic murein transglycosylase